MSTTHCACCLSVSPAPLCAACAGRVVSFAYTNHRGKTGTRRVIPRLLRFDAAPPWHPEPQWLLVAYDLDREAERTFAIARVLGHWLTPIGAAPPPATSAGNSAPPSA